MYVYVQQVVSGYTTQLTMSPVRFLTPIVGQRYC